MKRAFLFIAALSLLAVSSCKDAPTEPNVTEPSFSQIYSQVSGVLVPNLDNLGEIGGVMGTFLIKQNIGTNVTELATAQFGKTGVDVGIVDVNDFILSKQLVGNRLYYTSTDGLNPTTDIPDLDFDGSDHYFLADGNNDIPEIDTWVESAIDFDLDKPQLLGVYNRSNGLEVEWTGGSIGSDERILITISSTANNQSETFLSKDVPNTGSYRLTPNELSTISGSVVFTLAKYRIKADVIQNKTYVTLSEIIFQRAITLI